MASNNQIIALHEELFGFAPEKLGVAYERVAALVLAVLGWRDVTHDVKERSEGKTASHQLDVVAHDPSGHVGRLLVECKDYATVVGEETMNTLVGVMKQLGTGTAAVVTTKGFTEGARSVAVDEDIALVILRHFDPVEDRGRFVMKVSIKMKMMLPTLSNFDLVIDPETVAGVAEFKLTTDDHLRHTDGNEAEKLRDVLEKHAAPLEEGTHERRADFADGRLIKATDGGWVRISGLKWTERLQAHEHTIEVEGKGTPTLVLQQLDSDGEVVSGRLVVDRDLHAWGIDEAGRVTPRGYLTNEGPKP